MNEYGILNIVPLMTSLMSASMVFIPPSLVKDICKLLCCSYDNSTYWSVFQ